MNKKAFTLTELIGVITILGFIAIIAFPPLLKQIKGTKGKIDEATKQLIVAGASNYIDENKNDFPKISGNTYCITLQTLVDDNKISNDLVDSKGEKLDLNKYVNIKVDNKTYKYFIDVECQGNYIDLVLNGADPVLKTGMIPVTINADGTVKKANVREKWYDYANKKWANVVLVTNDSRSDYQKMEAGNIIAESDILAYFVWIPRYKYKLWYTEATDGDNGYVDESKIHSIDVVFEGKKTIKSKGNQNGQYLTHPAFTFGSEELNGIWVGKFETGYNGAKTTSEAEVSTADSTKVIIKSNNYAWRGMNVSSMFYTTLNMNDNNNVFGLANDGDTHMMKNTEWGAVAYLSHSRYGVCVNNVCKEVEANSNDNYITGYDADSNAYGATGGIYDQSTTANITGAFDMAGGTWEAVMGYASANESFDLSGFTIDNFPSEKYINRYEHENVDGYMYANGVGNVETLKTISMNYSKRILGDATGELGPFKWNGIFDTPNGGKSISISSSWYFEHAATISALFPWYIRGGNLGLGIFYFAANNGNGEASGDDNPTDVSFRVVIS